MNAQQRKWTENRKVKLEAMILVIGWELQMTPAEAKDLDGARLEEKVRDLKAADKKARTLSAKPFVMV